MFEVVGSGVGPHHLCCRILLSSINHHHIWIKHQLCLSVNQLSIIHLSSTKNLPTSPSTEQKDERARKRSMLELSPPCFVYIFFLNQPRPKIQEKNLAPDRKLSIVEIFLTIFRTVNNLRRSVENVQYHFRSKRFFSLG